MSIGTITLAKGSGEPSQNTYADQVSFAGEDPYEVGGMPFKALFQAAAGDGRNPIAVIPGDCGGYVVAYIPSTGKLKVFIADADGADGPLIEVGTIDLSSVTFNLVVLSQ